ncbi:MAG: MerR family transcriptional regulator, partial [Deltaproteobacteria bacterium]|nr:MerR family transcriptional regulator [Deltaproteobacteria bacterium]
MPSIPNKLYFRIGEVSKLIGVEPYVLRYWESEFQDIKPSKSKSGQRLYKRRDVELLQKIKELLYEERYTING